MAQNTPNWFDSQFQLPHRIIHGPTDLVWCLPVRPPVERSTGIGAGQPELDVIRLVNCRVLATCEPGANYCRRAGNIPSLLREEC